MRGGKPVTVTVVAGTSRQTVVLNASLSAALTVANLGRCSVIPTKHERARWGGELVAEFRALTPARDPIAEDWRLRWITLSLLVLVLAGAVG